MGEPAADARPAVCDDLRPIDLDVEAPRLDGPMVVLLPPPPTLPNGNVNVLVVSGLDAAKAVVKNARSTDRHRVASD